MIVGGGYNNIISEVSEEDSGISLKNFFREKLSLSSRLVTLAKQKKNILVNDKSVKLSYILKEKDKVELIMEEHSNIEAQDIPLKILYEDIDVLVIDKEPFTVVHPTRLHTDYTLINAVRFHALKSGEDYKPHLINRLDRDTSGLMIIAKNPYAHFEIMKQMEAGEVKKTYIGLIFGSPQNSSGTINAPIDRAKTEDIRRIISEEGKESITEYCFLEKIGNYSLCEFNLITGRTHQIRVHMSYIGHPLAGDILYGDKGNLPIDRQALHSYKINFKSPRMGSVSLQADLPDDIKNLISFLKNSN